jgi:hypothetical protein
MQREVPRPSHTEIDTHAHGLSCGVEFQIGGTKSSSKPSPKIWNDTHILITFSDE